jgi:hypothetical protein
MGCCSNRTTHMRPSTGWRDRSECGPSPHNTLPQYSNTPCHCFPTSFPWLNSKIIFQSPRNTYLWKRKQNKVAIGNARSLVRCCQLSDKNFPLYFKVYLKLFAVHHSLYLFSLRFLEKPLMMQGGTLDGDRCLIICIVNKFLSNSWGLRPSRTFRCVVFNLTDTDVSK